jgi:hypothetical protein
MTIERESIALLLPLCPIVGAYVEETCVVHQHNLSLTTFHNTHRTKPSMTRRRLQVFVE